MADWNPELYRRFEAERTRPAAELLARIANRPVSRAADLGCGSGNSTALLLQTWPQADICGIDNSPAMIAAAQQRLPQCRFVETDLIRWQADAPLDLIFANASLQWTGNHEHLLPRLLAQLATNGVLAVQMPDNLEEPAHRLMRKTAAQPRWRQAMAALRNRDALPDVSAYYDILTRSGCRADIWRTTYYHVMPSVKHITEWFQSTALRPFLNLLEPHDQQYFLADYTDALHQAYPVQADGCVLLPFPRLFIVAEKI